MSAVILRPFAVRVIAVSIALLFGGRLASGVAGADEPTTSEPAPTLAVGSSSPSGPERTADAPPSDSAPSTVSTPATVTVASYLGRVFGDVDRDGVADPGEELAGAEVVLAGSAPQVTDAQGRFAFTDVVTGDHLLRVSLEGWNPVTRMVSITETPGEEDVIGLTRPLVDSLRVSLAFLDSTYQVGQNARIRIELHNTGPAVLQHLHTTCFPSAFYGLIGTSEGWRPLRVEDDGVTLAPGETRTLDVSEPVPPAAGTVGYVSAICAFGIFNGLVEILRSAATQRTSAAPPPPRKPPVSLLHPRGHPEHEGHPGRHHHGSTGGEGDHRRRRKLRHPRRSHPRVPGPRGRPLATRVVRIHDHRGLNGIRTPTRVPPTRP
jgi:hypothetical protein